MSEIKPCPFCGQELSAQPDLFSGGMRYDHENNCINKIKEAYDFRELWNSRPSEDTLLSENTRLRDALGKILSMTSKSHPTTSGVRDSVLIEIIEGGLK